MGLSRMTLTRRQFVAGTSSLTLLGSPIFSSRADQLKKKNLVIVILRGGLDGLGAVSPIADYQLLVDIDIHRIKSLVILCSIQTCNFLTFGKK